MTRMLDILEDFLCWRKYTYFRMDGSTSIPDRRYMVEEYQKNPDVFAFLLSTRAGGLGVNLIAADTVIFYDNDWNPTMDAQATDRAHRIGQTKTVRVYRLVTKGTVEEKIVKRAKQKQSVQSTVYGGNALKADVFRAKEVFDMLLDEDEQNELKERQQKFLKTKRVKKAGKSHADHNGADEALFRDSEMIDTSSAAVVAKKKDSPAKPVKKEKEEVAKKPSRKPAPEKPQKAVQNLFSTTKSSGGLSSVATSGPFGIIKTTLKQTAAPVEYSDDGEEDEDDEDDEEAIKAKKLL